MKGFVRLKRRMEAFGCYLYITILAVFAAFPLLWLFVCSIKESGDLLSHPTSLIPEKVTMANYYNVMVNLNLGVNIKNSLMVSADIRLNYEKYFYDREAVPRLSEQDKAVAELVCYF